MKKIVFLSILFAIVSQFVYAQKGKNTTEGTPYYLPRTELRFAVMVEKTSYTPGEFAIYAEKYMKIKDVGLQPAVTYRIIGLNISSVGGRDTSKYYLAPTDGKHNIQNLEIDDSGILLAVNAEPKVVKQPVPFVPAQKPVLPDPRDYMNEDILSAGSSAKMAEFCAMEIYDIRESKSLLNKGQADFMPKDGEQLRIMLDNLETQEAGLMQLFRGVTVKDTVETIVRFVPDKETEHKLLFRFSKWSGVTDIDDLGGNPYYISVEDKHTTPSIQDGLFSVKSAKDNSGIYVNLPGKIRLTVYRGREQWAVYELYAAQFGRVEQLNDELFGKKYFTGIVLNPVTGNMESFRTEPVRK